jgi:hypothetical protein
MLSFPACLTSQTSYPILKESGELLPILVEGSSSGVL